MFREPGLLSSVLSSTDAMPVVESEGDLRLAALESLAAEQSAQGQPPYVPPDDRYGLFPSSAVPTAPTLRTQQYENPTAAAAAAPAPPAVTSTGVVAPSAGDVAAPSPPRASKPPPRPRPQRGTFSNMMMARPESPAEAPAAAVATASTAAAAAAPVRKKKGAFAPNMHTYTEEGDGLADILFGGGGGGPRGPKPPGAPREVAAPPPAPPPLVDLLGGFDDEPVPAASPGMANAGLDDLLGGGATAEPAAAPADDLLAGLDAMDFGAAPVPAGSDPFGMAAPAGAAQAPEDPMSGLDMLSAPAPPTVDALPGPGMPQGVPQNGQAAGYPMQYPGMPQVPQGMMPGYAGTPAGAIGGPQQVAMPGMPGVPAPIMEPMVQAGAPGASPPAAPAADVARNSGTLQAKNPDKKGDAFADLLSF